MTEELTPVLLAGVDAYVKESPIAETGDFSASMKELAELAKACFYEPVGTVIQKLDTPNPALYIGPGKVREIKEAAEELGAVLVIFNDTLSPTQMRNLKDDLDLPVLDRTGLILDIFEKRARTKEAKLQVETAKLQYLLPRLTGLHEALTRQGGTSGSMSSRGAGETKLELDRRHIEHRLTELNRELKQIVKDRETMRKKRLNSGIPRVALVGYTNAGKSTVLNSLLSQTGQDDAKKVFEADMLFATLDSYTRLIAPADGRDFLLTDTVGFIHKLPAGLIKAFRSTLEEAVNADLLLLVADYSDPGYPEQIEVTKKTLAEIGAGDIPRIVVYNKCDRREGLAYPRVRPGNDLSVPDRIYVSAREENSLLLLTRLVCDTVYRHFVEATFLIPYSESAAASVIMQQAHVSLTEYQERGTLLTARCPRALVEKYRRYLLE